MTLLTVVGASALGGLAVLAASSEPQDPPPVELGPRLTLEAGDRPGEDLDRDDEPSFPTGYKTLDQLEPATVLEVEASGFSRHAVGRAMQCVTILTTICTNEIPVQFGEEGKARFQYLVTDTIAPVGAHGRCRALAPPCSIVVEEIDGNDRAEHLTVFSDPAPRPGSISLTPRTGLDDGDTVDVEVADFPPGALLAATICAAPHVVGDRHCEDPASAAEIQVGSDGRGSATVSVRSGPVGTDATPCGGRHRRPCGISVWSPDLWPRAPAVPIEFARAPGPQYDRTRLGAGLLAVAALLLAAWWIVRRTDWSATGEAAAPEIDDASYADLDAIVAALPPDPDEGATP